MTRWLTKALALAIATVWVAGSALAQPYTSMGDGVSAFNGAPNYPLISGFETIEEDSTLWGNYGFWDPDADCVTQGPPCWDFNENGRDFLFYDLYSAVGGADAPQGNDAMWMDWSVFSDQGWGGSSALQHRLPDSTVAAGMYYDFSDFTEIGISYNTLTPTSGSATTAFFRIKINEGSDSVPSEGHEDWYSEDQVMFQSAPGWNEVFIPLEEVPGCCGSGGFNKPGWSGIGGNDRFDLDKIVGFQLEFVAPGDASLGDSVVAGVTVWDNFRVRGVRYDLLTSFEGMPTTDSKQSNAGTYTLTTSADATHDAGALQVDYSIVGDQGWGGEVDLFFEPDGQAYFGDADKNMAERTAITVFYKVLTPSDNPVTFSLRVIEESDGNEELWEFSDNAEYVSQDGTGRFRRFLAPFDQMVIPGWSTTHDGVLDQTKIKRIQYVLYVTEGTTSVGSILFDRMTTYGFQETDNTAPDAVAGFSVAQSQFSNLVTWTDVPGETEETYTVYVSETPITDVMAEGVGVLAGDVAEGTEIAEHMLYYPRIDGAVTHYYAITAKDRAGNTSDPSIFGSAVTNTARGIPTIHLGTPAGFAADGDVGEWAGITPIHLEDGTLFGHTGGGVVPTAADLSADIYMAIDADFLYFAFDVTDDVYDPIPDGEGADRWMYDGGEFYLGLYDGRATTHTGFAGGDTPDYKFYVYKAEFFADQANPLAADGDGNYKWMQTATGWAAEGKVALDDLATEGRARFTPENGTRVPLDIVIMDDDTAPGGRNRETVFTYSPNNNDNSWQGVQHWFYTWIGDAYSTGVEAVPGDVPTQYALQANYPNPFNPTTTFRYELPQSSKVTLRVFNLLGQEVRTLVNTDQAAGTYEVSFDASNLASGVYLYALQAGDFLQTRKMTLVR